MENDYILRINQAINYIYQHRDQNLTVEEIAAHCRFSKYYFNRVFKSVAGDSIYAFIKRIKLEYAAHQLRINKRKSITDVALEIGYSPSNFASVFKACYGISASEFRKQDVPIKDSYQAVVEHIHALKQNQDFFAAIDSQITVKPLAAMNLEYQRFIGNYRDGLVAAWQNFCLAMEQKYAIGPDTQMVGISYDDPLLCDENQCIYDMCIPVNQITGINIHRIKAGLYACYRFHDRLDHLLPSYNELFALWMPFCNYRLDERPCLEIYHSGLEADGKICLEICIPLL